MLFWILQNSLGMLEWHFLSWYVNNVVLIGRLSVWFCYDSLITRWNLQLCGRKIWSLSTSGDEKIWELAANNVLFSKLFSFTDVNECAENTDLCDKKTTYCINTYSSYSCRYKLGYMKEHFNPYKCIDKWNDFFKISILKYFFLRVWTSTYLIIYSMLTI